MAGETTTTSVTELIYGEWISPYIQSFAGQYKNPSQFLAEWNPTNGSSTVSVPRWVSDQGTPNDDGAAIDTEMDAAEATDIAALELETTDSTFSVVEYGIRRDPSDTAIEDSSSAEALISYIASDGSSNLMAAFNDDICALFASFSNSSGATGVDMSIANVDDALYALADRAIIGELVGVLDNQAARDFLTAMQAVGTSMAQYAQAADRMMAASFDKDQGRNVEGYVCEYKGVKFYRNGMTDTANTGADVVSAIFLRGDVETNRPLAALGKAKRREFRVETQRDASKRTTEVVMTMRDGAGITQNGSGQKLVTDA